MIDFLIDFIQTEKFLVLLGLGLTALIVWLTGKTTRLKWREMKQTRPLIVSVKRYEKDSVKITIANNKPHNITVKHIAVKKCVHLKIFIMPIPRKVHSTWKPETKEIFPGPGDRKLVDQYTIDNQEDFYLIIPNIEKRATYKIFVETSAGNCQSIYHSQLKHQA